ncbi:MAG: 30S ribosomal protein S2 [bacterium]|nr:30S ribosomal protein S2 [bacterium]
METTIIQGQEKELSPVNEANLPILEEMTKAGLFMGKKSSKTHPRMKSMTYGTRNGIEIIDLEETLVLLEKAMAFVTKKVSEKGTLLIVGTTPAAKDSVEVFAKKMKLLHVVERWLGGTLTNFKTLSKRIAYFKKLKSDREAGRLEKYTKKERLGFDRTIIKMTTMFSGIENMEDVPSILFVIDVKANDTAVREAKILRIPVIGVLNTDTNPTTIEYPIPANDRSKMSIDWVLARLEKAIEAGRAVATTAAAHVATKGTIVQS